MLEVKNVCCGYNGINIVKQVSFNINRGENLCIVGPNGCGKSTLLKAISNLISFNGEIKLDGKNINALKRKELATKIALMTQSSNIQFPYTIFETVALGRYAHLNSIFSRLSKKDEEVINESLKMVGLLDIKDKLISELSGGQLQRVFLARAFAQDPEVILLDEPTNHLDLRCQIEILDYLKSWAKEKNKIVIAVLHDLNLVQNYGDRVLMLNDGVIKRNGNTKEVLNSDDLEEVYGIDIKTFMVRTLEKWK
ncbi:ABC transporter ATP-binding protein [Clostridium tertium]|jgi:iron complex transport system ATP-binding protein|uniref:ABC transporter ATP-binding protein n=1 Tax=Clostridium tertium TaxID=1559 RepID=A0A9X4B3M4_9CLOT|nr:MULTISPECIES: ABC transporter ATP-binding protein [Clostridium]MDB1940251.1 ABC transporter ATP-binding protein [Clostridium tertium]MDB1954306.1 ABC transporter ATP-binding protein [Clostridium tertium]MDB1957277.1 ABC transporter ATP-binding protein [Clostridium tertium]MDB1963135.1 ABC transporter ATP-binding protein [Clostridium tertium]MDB1965795.1 ABC transporter ATP-binding protein [Clostridium tertium]